MDRLLVVGAESIVGANLCAVLAGRFQVTALSFGRSLQLVGCVHQPCRLDDRVEARRWLKQVRPDWVVGCFDSAGSSWHPRWQRLDGVRLLRLVRTWADTVAEWGCPFTFLSSDGVFTGPWMFHDEQSTCFSNSPSARACRRAEQVALTRSEHNLVVRTHVLGWSAAGTEKGWFEWARDQLECGRRSHFSIDRYATPLPATALANVLERAYDRRLCGLYHVAGTERVSPAQLATRLAARLGVDVAEPLGASSAWRGSSRDGRNGQAVETSLQTRRVRACLGVRLPTVDEALAELEEQATNGFRELLGHAAERELVA